MEDPLDLFYQLQGISACRITVAGDGPDGSCTGCTIGDGSGRGAMETWRNVEESEQKLNLILVRNLSL